MLLAIAKAITKSVEKSLVYDCGEALDLVCARSWFLPFRCHRETCKKHHHRNDEHDCASQKTSHSFPLGGYVLAAERICSDVVHNDDRDFTAHNFMIVRVTDTVKQRGTVLAD